MNSHDHGPVQSAQLKVASCAKGTALRQLHSQLEPRRSPIGRYINMFCQLELYRPTRQANNAVTRTIYMSVLMMLGL